MTIQINIATQTLHLDPHVFHISSAKNGVGETPGSFKTPRGSHVIHAKIGGDQPLYTVFRGRIPTGDVWTPALSAKQPDRDFILSRILWLTGPHTPLDRYIYIHGTSDEANIGTPVSHGCIRMCNKDVLKLYNLVSVGDVVIIKESL